MGAFGKKLQFAVKSCLRLLRGFVSFVTANLRWLLCCTQKVQENKVIFMTFHFRYACNPKYICEEILEQNLPLEIVWVVTRKQLKDPKTREQFPENAKLVAFGSYGFIKEMATAKVWVDNAFNFTWNPIPKKKGQFYIQNWHGSLGLKRIGKEQAKDLRWLLPGLLNARYVDVCISNSVFETDVYRKTYWPQNEILELGHARNDILFTDDAAKARIREKVLQYFSIPKGTRIALYGPTYREQDAAGIYNMDHNRILDALESRFGDNWVLLNRFHHKTQKALCPTDQVNGRVIPAAVYPDMQELMVAADVGITDYSSWIYDFMLTGRPGFLYVPDLEKYDQERGFYYPLSETPFPFAQTNRDMAEKILSFDEAAYRENHARFLSKRGCKENGTAAKKIVQIIKEQCGIS